METDARRNRRDTDIALLARLTAVILEEPTCGVCLSGKTGADAARVGRAIQCLANVLQICVDHDGRCRVCGRARPVYSLKRTPGDTTRPYAARPERSDD